MNAQPPWARALRALTIAALFAALLPAAISPTSTYATAPAITLSATDGVTTEAGGTGTLSVALASQPTLPVTINLVSGTPVEGTTPASNLTFTPANWNTAQTVTVTGVDDAVDDGNATYTITATASSSDSTYDNLSATINLINEDDDVSGLSITSGAAPETTESGDTVTYAVALTSEPTANITIPVASLDTSEGLVAPASLSFTAANWNTPQEVTVAGVNDFVVDGDQPYQVRFGAPTGDAKYSALPAQDVNLLNLDNDVAAIVIFPTVGTTSEAGGSATFRIVLTSQPTANVTIPLASTNPAEGSVVPASVVFNATNWNILRTVTVTGVDDFLDDGDQTYSVITGAAESTDGLYNGQDASDLSLTNVDNDGVGFVVSAISNDTTEAGGTATFTARLSSQPTADVSFPVASLNLAEGTLSATSLAFTAANWNVNQTVTVTGVNDDVDDNDQSYAVALQRVTSSDPLYNNLNPADVPAINRDDDTAGVTVSPTSGLITTEAGSTATFSVQLTSEPTANVRISLSSDDTGEGTVAPVELTFTPENWDTAQSVTLTGVDDAVDDDDQAYTIVTSSTASNDAKYDTLVVANVDALNTDDDIAGVTVTAPKLSETSEGGQSDSLTIVLDSEPTANVEIGLVSSDTSEGDVDVASVIFTAANWNTAQTVTVNGVDDDVDDGDQSYTVTVQTPRSDDPNYGGVRELEPLFAANSLAMVEPIELAAVNYDNDTAGVTVSPISNGTTEAGGTASFTVKLDSQPTADVSIAISSSDLTEGTVPAPALTFTPANWNTPQTVTVTGVGDLVDDGDIAYTIITSAASSTDPLYSDRVVGDVSLFNIDDDGVGVSIIPVGKLTLGRSVTTEAAGTATFEVTLNSLPTADVTVPFSSSNTAEGAVAPTSLTFNASNWDVPQTVTVTGVDDDVDDGDSQYSLVAGAATSTDATYGGENPADAGLTNFDDDTASVAVSPTTGLTTAEAGSTATFTVDLTSEPTADVTVDLTSSDTTEGTVAPAPLTFTPANWDTPQTVTVTGVDDLLDDGTIAYAVATGSASADADYDKIAVADVALTNTDDDTATVIVAPTTGLTTSEAGGSATFSVTLGAQPSSNVVVSLTSNDLTEGAPAQSVLTFTPESWNTPQTATVIGNDDLVGDGDIAYSVVTALQSGDPAFAALNPADVALTNLDDDGVGVTITPTQGLTTTEAGGTGTFTVKLDSQPIANVTISMSSDDTTEGTVAPATLTFTAANWNTAQTVTVTGVDDSVKDGDIAYTIVTETSSPDPLYAAVNPTNVAVVNLDNDVPDLFITPSSLLRTTEQGGQATFTVALRSQPSAPVVVTLASSDATEGTVAPATLTFTAANWSAPQTVTLTGVDDKLDDGDVIYTIVTAYQTSDPLYGPLNPTDVAVLNIDNDTRLYLPLIARAVTERPDLTVTAITFEGRVTVVIKNQGAAAVTSPFWVDFYINPRIAPTRVNDTWELVATRGMTWGITGVTLQPGASLVLSRGDRFYRADRSNPGEELRKGDVVFAQADSANTAAPLGGVTEVDELPGRIYNNILRAEVPDNVLIGGAGSTPAPSASTAALPERP